MFTEEMAKDFVMIQVTVRDAINYGFRSQCLLMVPYAAQRYFDEILQPQVNVSRAFSSKIKLGHTLLVSLSTFFSIME